MICINKNLNSYKILSNVFSEAEIAQLYIDNKYALPTDEESYQLVKAFSDKPTQIKEGVEELFESNPELANAVYESLIGKPEQGKTRLWRVGSEKNDTGIWFTDKMEDLAFYLKERENPVLYYVDVTKEELEKAKAEGPGIGDNEFQFIYEKGNKLSEGRIKQITPQQKQQAQQLYSQYLEQNPNGNVEQFKSWVEEFNRKTNIQGAYDFSASSNSGKWNSANNELLSLVQDNRKAFAIYKFLIGDMETFKEIVDFLNERGVEIPYTDRMKRADETMTAEERKSAIDSYNNSVDSKVEDKAQVEKDILSENNLQDETDYTPQKLIEKYPLTGVQKVIWNLIKDIVNKLGIKVKFSSSRITEGFDGSNNPQNGEILIRPSTLKNGRFGEVLVHEIVHSLTTKIISRVNSGVTTGLTQKQINAVKGLMKLFKAIKADNNLENKYPVKDVFEFIAHLTNEKFVKELESKDKNFLQKVVDFILDIVGITNANELSKKYLLDIISDGVFLQENGVTVLPSDYGSNVQASLSDFITQKSQKRLNQIQDIFNENPELANAVYEAAGLKTLENNKLEQDIKELIKGREDIPSSIFLSYLVDNNLIPKIQEYITSIGYRHGEWNELYKRLTLDYSPINTKSEKTKLISHELMHALSHKYITSYEALRQPDFKQYIDKINENEKIKGTNRTIELVNLTKEQLDALDNLVRIKEKVFDFIKAGKFNKNEKLTNANFGSLNYAFSELDKKEDIHEFISEAFSNPILIDVLKQIPTEGNKSNLFKEFIKALKIILGFNNESIIEDILYYSEKAFINEALKESNTKKQQATLLYSQYLDSLNKPNTNPILQGNQQEQVKKFAELQERLNNKEFLEGAKSAYESTPALQELGTQEEYNDYIARVSLGILKNPSSGEYNYTSKVKDIVYHGNTGEKIESRTGNNIGIWYNTNPNIAREYNVSFDSFGVQSLALYKEVISNPIFTKYVKNGELNISKDKEFSKLYDAVEYVAEVNDLSLTSIQKDNLLLDLFNEGKKAYNKPLTISILNLQNPITVNGNNKTVFEIEENLLKLKGNSIDGFIIKDFKEANGSMQGDNYVAFEPEQIHILGSKQDIEGFKDFVSKESSVEDMPTTPVALSPKVLTELQESKLKEFIDKEDSFIKTIGVERTEQLVTYTFEKVVSSIEQGNGARAGFNSVLNVLQERLDELQEVSDNREEYELDEDYIQVLENTIKATKDTIDNFNVIVNRVNFELENTKGLVEDEDNSEDNGGDAKGERYNVEAYEIDPIIGISSKLKLFLSGIKAISPKAVSIARAQYKQRLMDENNELPEQDRKTEEEIDSIVNQLDENLLFDTIADESDLYDKTWFLQDALMPFRNVHKQLLVELAGVEESYEAVIAKLRQSAKEKYWINQVIDKLEKADTQTKNQFVSEMPKHNLSMEFVQLSKKYVEVNGKKISFYTTYVRKSNSNEVSQLVLENWKNDFISSDMVTPEVDDYVFNVDKVRELSEDMGNILSEVASKPKVKVLKGKVSTKEIFYKNLQNSISYAEEINVIRNSNAKPAVNIGTEGNVNTYIINEDGSLELYENDFGNLATKVQNLYKRVGISLSDNTVNYLIKNSTGTSYLDELSNVIDYISENIDARLFEDNTDPINQSSIKTLAALEARLNPNPNIMPTSFRTQGKDVFAFTAKNFLNDRAKALLTQELLNNLKRTPFAKDSKYIPIIERYLNGTASVQEVKLVEAMGIIEDLDLQVIKNLERVIAYGDKRFTRIDEIEQELVSLGLFVNSNTKPVDGKRIARYVFPTFSDKTRSAVVGMEAEEYSYDYENKTVTDETVDRVFKSTVEAELKRIINYHAKGHSTSNNEQYAMGGGLFFFFPTMNGIMIQTETGVENIHNAIKFQVTQMGELNKGVKEYEETSLSEGIVEAIKQELKTQLNSQIDAKVDVWNEYELLKFVTENNVTSLKEAGFDYKYLTKFNKNNNFKNEADIERALRLFAADYKINDIVAKAEMHKLYLGDPAMMFKKSKNHSEIVKRMTLNDQLSAEDLLNLVKEAQTNIGKRLALEIATGKKSAENASKNYIQLMAKDPVVKSATLSYLSRVLDGKVFDLDNYAKLDDDGKKAYIAQFPNTSTFINIDGADAQELTTLKEYLTTDIDFGKTDITLEEIDEILAIEEKDKITAEEFEKLSSFLNKITTQPQKPVYSGDVYDPDTDTMRVVYIKTSAFPLSKHFTKDFQIDNLRKAMIKLEKETGLNVRMSYSTGNKLGAVTKANALTIFDNEGNVLSEEDIYDSINNEISIVDGKRKLTPRSFNQLPYLVLPRKNFRIQQENPLKRKSTIKGGSQERKLLWMDLLTLNNPEINKLYGEYMNLYESLYQEEFDKLMSEITTTNAEGEKVLSITKASELLLKEAKSRNYPIQDIRGLNIVKGNFAVPLMFHGSSERYESLINSIINNRLANIQMPGHSYILGSSEGFKVREVSEKYPIPAGTIFVKEGITDLKNSHFVELVKDENGNIIDRIPITKNIESYNEGEIEFVPAQVIVPNTIYVEIDGKKEKIYLEEFVFTKDNKKYLDVSRFNPDLLKVFGFRIPTSGQMSMATMEIVGFMPENQGDLLLAPRDFTKQMGSDFDVDKLYTYNYEVEAYFDKNGKPQYRKKDSKRNRIIEIHHNLLSLANTNVQRKVLSPLSFDIAKEQADLIESSKGYVPSILDDEYQKMKRIGGAAGKSGTGKYSLAITLHSSLQQAAFNRTKQEYIESELLQIGTYTQEGDFIPFRMTIAGLKFDGKLGKSNTLSLTGKSIRDISDVLAQRQNYSVDNEKEQLMFRLNDNKYTMPFNMFMDLAGFDLVTVKDNNNGTVNISITDFLRTQPVILEYVKLRNLGKTEIEAFEELDKKYPFSEDFAFEAESASFAQQLFNGTANQSAVLNIFKSASEEGAKLGSLSSAYNTDSSGLGKSIFDVIDKENKIVNLYNSFYNIGNFNANTINGIVTNQALQASEMFEAIMPYRNLSFILFDKVKAITGNDLNVDDMQDVFREFKKHIFASHLIKNFDDSAGSITDIRREMFFHTEENESFANYAKYVQQITPMALLNGMTFEINTNDLPSVITWNNSIKSDNETRFYTDFLAMFTNKTALRPYNGKPMTYQKFAQMLVTYAYLEGGIQGGYQYIKYVPVEYLQATGMADALTNVQNYVKTVKPFDEDKIAEIVNDNFFVQLVQHNPSLVKNKINLSEFFGKVIGANAKEFKNVTEFSTKEKEKPRFFRVYNYQSDVKNRRIRKKEAEVLFIYDENTNKYYRIPSKGIYGMSEYDYMSNEIRSLVNAYNKNTVLDNNKALIEETKAESEFKLSKVSTVKDLLDFVSKSNNEFNRTIAQSLKGIADNVPVTIDNSIDSAGLATSNSIILRKDYIEGLLKMNKFSEVEAVILEEVLHTVTIDYLRNPENHTEDIQRKVASIKKLYTKAFDKALEKKLFTLSEMEMIKKSYETAITPEQKVAYSLMDEYEFVARIISEPNTREALSKIKSGNKTYLERILDEISELINSVLKMLGISNDTITAEGIEATLDLVSAIKAQKVKDAKDTVEIRLQGKPIESKVPLSNTMSNFLNNYFTGEGESFFDNLTEEDKLSIATALARVYKDVNKMTFESIYDSDSAEEVFYYFATGKVLKEDVRNSSQFTKAVKEVKDYVNENQKFIDGYNKIASNPSISQKVKDEQKKEYDAILEKHNFLKNKVYSIEFDIRLKLLAKENYVPDFEYNFTSSLPIQPVVEETSELFDPNLPKVNIYAGTGENAELSNFAIREFTYEGQKYASVEQAFQHQKIAYSLYDQPEISKKILSTTNGGELKKLGKSVKDLVDNWDSISSNIMKKLIKSSFEQNPNALQKLLATGNAELTHTQDKGKWGKEFPKLLMEVRQELRGKTTATTKSFTSVKPTIDLSREWRGDLESRPVYTTEGVNTMRTEVAKKNEHFGNPFSEAGYGDTIKVDSIGQAVQFYKDWLLYGELAFREKDGSKGTMSSRLIEKEPRRQWILNQINQGKLDGATLLYAGKLAARGKGSHAVSLAEVVEELRGKPTQPTTQETTATTQPATTKKVDLSVNNPKEYTNHSGGALGADSMFDIIGQEFGVTNHKHYYYGSKTPKGNVLLTDSQIQEGISEMNKAAKILNRNPSKQSTINLLARNWFQVKNSTQIIAIAPIDDSMSFVEGGTGWAVAMAQSNNKEIHVFNLKDNLWYTWNGNIFVKSSVPVLAKNFAGIGSRQEGGKMTQESINAIRNVYSNTFNIATQSTATETTSTTQPATTESRVEEKIEIPKYEVNYNLQNKDGSKRFAQVSPEGVITINPVKNIQELFDYMEGKEGGVTSAQKKLVLDELSKQGYPMSKLKQIITTNKIANTFLILHEQDHIDNKDKDVYWLQGRDLNTPDKIAIETRATVNSLKKLEKMFPPKGNLPEGFEKIGSLSPIVKPKTVSVSGLPTIIVDENKQSRCN